MSSTTFIIDIFSGVYAADVLDSDTWICPVFEWKIRPKKQKHRLQRDANEQNCPWESLKREAEALATLLWLVIGPNIRKLLIL
jgi:hypothetical protein